MRAVSELAGFSVHPHEKPPASALSSLPLADRPAFAAFTPSEISERFRGDECSIYNRTPFRYYDGPERTRYSYTPRDTKEYARRETPVGCLYTLTELPWLAEAEAKHQGGTLGELDRLRYSRLSAILFTGHGLYRIYSTERTAPRLRKNGEDSAKIFLMAWADNVYKGSLRELQTDGQGNLTEKFTTERLKGTILFGDDTHQAALSVLKNTWDTELWNQRGKTFNKIVQNFNLHMIPDVYYLPVVRQAIPLYSMMIFPHWPSWVKIMGREYMDLLAERGEAPAIQYERIEGDDAVNGTLTDGSVLVTLVALRLDAVYHMVSGLSAGEHYTVVAMEWQRPFFDGLAELLTPEEVERLRIHYMPQDYLENFVRELHEKHGNPYDG